MARQESLNITQLSDLNTESGKVFLAEEYGKVIENVQKNAISSDMKNKDLSGDPNAGSVEAKRFANATSQNYGTARKAGAGNAVKAKPVTVKIDTDKEIVEEVEEKDVSLLGVQGLISMRASNHALIMTAELDKAFFAKAVEEGIAVTTESEDVEDIVEDIIQQCENTQNVFVDGVPRSMMHLVCNTALYGKLRTYLGKVSNPNVDSADEEFYAYHGVRIYSCVNLPTGTQAVLMVDGAVAQPVMSREYNAEKIPLSDATGITLFYYYGTEAVTPDLIFVLGASA